ncbi:chemotaxis protein CheW [Pseudoalteromonas xiamenensis]
MNKHLFANEQVMKQYLNALLTEEEVAYAPELEKKPLKSAAVTEVSPVAKLLEQVRPEIADEIIELPEIEVEEEQTVEVTDEVVTIEPVQEVKELENQQNSTIIKEQEEQSAKVDSKSAYFDGEFQALFFEVAGLTLAVPLKALGGIHQLGDINQLFGKPKWFQGVMLNREQKLSVIDTARWVMPEKYTQELADNLDYQYLIMLGDSSWGLSAEKLVNNITLQPDDVKWRTSAGKRPWLAGVIKEKMCALIDVDNLIELLEKGLDSREQ